MDTETGRRNFMVWFTDDTIDPIPVRADSRPDAFRIGRKYQRCGVTAAVDEAGGAEFGDVSEDDFITEADV